MRPESSTKELQGNLDLPRPDHPADQPFQVSGWLFSRGRKIKAISLCHLSGWTLPLTRGVNRPDVALAFPAEPAALKSGFQCDVPVSNGFGAPEFQVRALLDDGAEETVFQIRFAPAVVAHRSPVHAPGRGARLRVLFIDDRLPDPAEGKGDGRANELLNALLDLGHKVSLFRMLHAAGPAWSSSRANVEILPEYGAAKLIEHLRSNASHYDCTLVSRPTNLRMLHDHLDLLPRPLIYDSEGIWAEMDSMAAAVRGQPWSPEETARKINEEVSAARDADVVLAVSPQDAAAFKAAGCTTVFVASHAVDADPGSADFATRAGMLFFGALEPGTPNEDSIRWFVGHVMPDLRRSIPQHARLSVIGPGSTPDLQSLGGPDVEFLGKQPDLRPFANRARIFVAPTRISAGIAIKLLHTAAMGLPAVATSQLANQLGWKDGEDVLVADSPEHFAACCKRLMQDEALWLRLRGNALERIRSEFSREQLRSAVKRALSGCRRVGRPVLVDCGTRDGESLRAIAKTLNVDASWEVHCYEANPACWDYYDRERLLDIPSLHVHRKAVGNLGRVVTDIAARADFIVLRLDAGGAEHAILRKMLEDGSLGYVNELHVALHSRQQESARRLKAEISARWPLLRLIEPDRTR